MKVGNKEFIFPFSLWIEVLLWKELGEFLKEARENAKILHCYGIPNVRPWNTSFHPYYEEYMKYMSVINPDFSLEQLDKMMEFKTSHPKLFEAYILLKNRDKLPNKTLNRVKKIIR